MTTASLRSVGKASAAPQSPQKGGWMSKSASQKGTGMSGLAPQKGKGKGKRQQEAAKPATPRKK